MKVSVNETKWTSLLARTHAFILYISISIFDFGPEKLPGLSRNGPQEWLTSSPITEAFVSGLLGNHFLVEELEEKFKINTFFFDFG